MLRTMQKKEIKNLKAKRRESNYESNLFHCPIVIFKKNKIYIIDTEFESWYH